MARKSRIGELNQQFLNVIKPEFNAWGLTEHPNPTSCFGRSEYGYHYDFADLRDVSNVRLASFAIIRPGLSLWIAGYKAGPLSEDSGELILLDSSLKTSFRLVRRWSILRPLNIGFGLAATKNSQDTVREVGRLVGDVSRELPRLKKYLYA